MLSYSVFSPQKKSIFAFWRCHRLCFSSFNSMLFCVMVLFILLHVNISNSEFCIGFNQLIHQGEAFP